MNSNLRVPKAAWSVLFCAAMLAAAAFSGCDSSYGPSAGSPEAQKQVLAQKQQIEKEQDKAAASLKKGRGGKNPPMLKSIKGGLNQGGAGTE